MFCRALNWKPVVSALVLILAFGYSMVCNDDQFLCKEDDSCIPLYALCDLKPNCPNGSDESYTICKTSDPENHETHCANGAQIAEGMYCNKIVDCLDGSDELPQLCDINSNWPSEFQGNCSKNDIECLPGECVSITKTCDNVIDCSNGLDESMEMCTGECEGCFRCANGVQFAEDQLCDGVPHCLDGTDELPSVCQNEENWAMVEPAICFEPLNQRFTSNTNFTVNKSTRFVYANQPVEVACSNSNLTFWNVCMNNGRFHHDFPSCKHVRINRSPDTNGTNGCPINYYNNETMLIKDVGTGKPIEVFPPLKNVRVLFECDEGYEFLPYHLKNMPVTCEANKQWNEKDFHPRCAKLCDPEEINGMYTLKPTCINEETDMKVECSDRRSMIPGTIANFECNTGFQHKTSEAISVRCSEHGTWDGLKELCRHQEDICHFNCTTRLPYATIPMNKNGVPTDPLQATWVVPIYIRNNITNRFEHTCVGNLVRLDAVVTAAHCIDNVTDPNDILVATTGNLFSSANSLDMLPVRSATKYAPYSNYLYNHDVAIIFLKKRMKLRQDQRIVCLPDENIDLQNQSPQVTSYSSDGTLSSVYGQISLPEIPNGDFNLTLHNEFKVCLGDSGSGVVVPCHQDHKCLVGVISRTERPGEARSYCQNRVTGASILSRYLMNFINNAIKANNNCPN